MIRIIHADVIEGLKTLESESVQCVVTSPPYWGLRDYGVDGQIGLEKTPDEYVSKMVEVFQEVKRVLRNDGTLWLVIGDGYASHPSNQTSDEREWGKTNIKSASVMSAAQAQFRVNKIKAGYKPKDLCGIPWRVAIALQNDGWWLRCDIVWNKPNPKPDNPSDRPSRCHEYVFLLTKSEKYFYGFEASREKSRNDQSVWNIAVHSSNEHIATFPEELVKRCIIGGSGPGDRVLDPFGGAGTTAKVARELKRDAILIELSAEYIKIMRKVLRLNEQLPGVEA